MHRKTGYLNYLSNSNFDYNNQMNSRRRFGAYAGLEYMPNLAGLAYKPNLAGIVIHEMGGIGEMAKSQVEEEKLKAKLIIENYEFKKVIFSTEDTGFCQGRIEFPLHCIGYEKLKNNFDANKLVEIQKVVINTFI